MIFDHMDDHMDGSMMGWDPNIWIYMILGFFIFLLIVIILIYLLFRGTSKNKDFALSNQESPKVGLIEEMEEKNPYFCPNCGEELDDKTLKLCPYCGSEI